MTVGIIMAASGNHSVFPAHAHLNLLGWVSLFLIGTFYRFHPALDTGRLAIIQAAIWICGTIILSCGVAAIYLKFFFIWATSIGGRFSRLQARCRLLALSGHTSLVEECLLSGKERICRAHRRFCLTQSGLGKNYYSEVKLIAGPTGLGNKASASTAGQ